VLSVPLPAVGNREVPAQFGSIEFRDVGFRFTHRGPWTLHNVSFAIGRGEHIAVIGASGQGKSTLGLLMCGLLPPTEGAVLIEGEGVLEYDRQALSKRMGVVLQEPLILEGSLAHNLSLREPDCSADELLRSAELARLDELLQRLPDGFASKIEAQGRNLSGGERQRLAIAQAMLGKPDIVVLDEATSALDFELEDQVMNNIEATGATIISITHRETIIRRAQRVFVVNDGRVSEVDVPRHGPPALRVAAEGVNDTRSHQGA
jgi:ABC-type bacteriocin/lantibiotic exporter with double-glycine peptidase domain